MGKEEIKPKKKNKTSKDFGKGRFVHLDKYQVVVYRVSCKDL